MGLFILLTNKIIMNKKEISAEYIGENLILLNHATGKFYQLNSTATLIWKRLQKI